MFFSLAIGRLWTRFPPKGRKLGRARWGTRPFLRRAELCGIPHDQTGPEDQDTNRWNKADRRKPKPAALHIPDSTRLILNIPWKFANNNEAPRSKMNSTNYILMSNKIATCVSGEARRYSCKCGN